MSDNTTAVLREVDDERTRQDEKWGEQNHPDGTGNHVALLHGLELSKRPGQVAVTMGTLAYTARQVTDSAARAGVLTWADILLEEVGEAFAEANPRALRAELIQVAAVAVQWVQAIDRRASTATPGDEDADRGAEA